MSGFYNSGKEAFVAGDMGWRRINVKGMLLSAAYVPDYVAHRTLASVPTANRLSTGMVMLGRVIQTGGIAFCIATTFYRVTGLTSVARVLLYQERAVGDDDSVDLSEQSTLLFCADGFTPVAPNNGDIIVTFPSGRVYQP